MDQVQAHKPVGAILHSNHNSVYSHRDYFEREGKFWKKSSRLFQQYEYTRMIAKGPASAIVF